MNLFINTTYSEIEIFCFKDNHQKLYFKTSKNNHTIVLYEVFNQMLQSEKIEAKDIEKIYIVSGPGSYTGTRVGVVFAKTLAYELNLDIYPVGLLDIIYLTTNEKPCADARGNKYFCYDGNDYIILTKEEALENGYNLEQKINYDNLIKELSNFTKGDVKKIKIQYMKEAI